MSHDEARGLVCCICTNLHGQKAARLVTKDEETVVKKEILPFYSQENTVFPSGICKRCIFYVKTLRKGGEAAQRVKLLLPEDYLCEVPRTTRKNVLVTCSCRWCVLARLNGLDFRHWQSKLKKKGQETNIQRICEQCFQGLGNVSSHSCSPTQVEIVRNLMSCLPDALKTGLALEVLQEKAGVSGEHQLTLPPAGGGHPVTVHIDKLSPPPAPMQPMSHEEVIVMATNAHLTGEQTTSIMADIRCKYGQKVVDAFLKPAIALHNQEFAQFFKAEVLLFAGVKDRILRRPSFYCHMLVEFLSAVADKRGFKLENLSNLTGADSGQGFFKMATSLVNEGQERKAKGARRTREQGIDGGEKFAYNGSRKIVLLFVCETRPESADNLETVFRLVGLDRVKYRVIGHFKFMRPCVCLMSCSSLNPCLYCPLRRDGKTGEWSDKIVGLRTLGGNRSNFTMWAGLGARAGAAFTSPWESCVTDLLVMGQGDTDNTEVLEKCIIPSVHLLLSLNDFLKCLEQFWPGLKSDLYKLCGVKAHDYHGKESDFEGPQCRDILKWAKKTEPYLVAGVLFFNNFQVFFSPPKSSISRQF